MSISKLSAVLVVTLTMPTAFAQNISAQNIPAQSARSVEAASADQAKEAKLEHFDPTAVDPTLDPCNDFYKYSCNKWLSSNPIPPDQVFWSTGSGLELWNESILRETLEAASKNDPSRSAVQQKIGDYWAACMDESGIEAAGLKPLQPELDRIAALQSKTQLTQEIAHLHHLFPGAWQQGDDQTNSPLFGFTGQQDYDDASKVVAQIDQGGLSLPNRDYYLKTDDKSKELLTKYRAHVKKMFVLSGESDTQAVADAGIVVELETAMAQAQMDNVKRRDPKNINNKMSLAQVKALTPSLDWSVYLKAVNAPASDHYIVTSPDFFRAEEKLIAEHPLDHWKAYLRWHLIHSASPTLTKAMVDENFDFFAHTLAGAEEQLPRWRRCVHGADRDLGEALGQAYVDRAFPPESKARTLQMVHSIETALGADIESVTWMSPVTKEQAIVKLKGIEDKIGYPSHWRDYSSVKIVRESWASNVEQASSFEFERWVNKIGKPVDRAEWTMTPPTINAYYDPQLNTINFPAGILQPPFFDAEKDDAVNYGAIGMVIGHEIIHGFDDQGRKFDAHGNLRDWWTPEDAKQYDERGKCISDEYTQEVPDAGPGVKQNGLLTQGEDTADNGGIHLALNALEASLKRQGKSLDDKGPDGWTYRQRFFVSYAYSWCASIRPQIASVIVTTDPHSLPVFRINNVVSNMPEFKQAFSCKSGQKMVRANACRVW
jgi:endothelin-converting enzyme/putative endopeptidase